MSDFFNRISQLPPKRLALLAMELQAKLEQAERRSSEAVAIIGVGCRFPGAESPDEFWTLLHDGVDAMRETPADRWDMNALSGGDPSRGVYPSSGGFLDRIDHFDPHFFGISPREAIAMDPQQRLLLEVSWEALERAGVAPDQLEGSRTAVFVGISSIDFVQLLASADPSSLDMYSASGGSHAIASGRISYTLGLHGPSLSIDTACSSSLVAVHLACQSLQLGDCRMALAGGVNLMISPETTISLAKAGMLAPNGRCKTFDAAADGFARGEGCGIVVLKRLSDAQVDGDPILAVIRGTAVNQDGRSSGITAPNGPAQEAVLREALEKSGLSPADIDYVETHGTGTVLGDPIEVRALAAVLARGREQPLLLGSVKTNFGHLEASAGVAGLIKTVLALDNEEIPAHLHFEHPNPHIEWDRLAIAVTREPRPWPRSSRRRVAGVSSFGFSGTNAHVIVEEAPAAAAAAPGPDRPVHGLALSAKTGPALRTLAARYAATLGARADNAAADVCFTANTGRATFAHRLFVSGASSSEFQRKLTTFAQDGAAADTRAEIVSRSDPPDVAFLFTGQGSQYIGMGRELFATQPAFRRAMQRCDEIVKPCLGESLLDILYPEPGRQAEAEVLLGDTRVTQPALFAVEYALAELWQSWGVRPTAVIGHSLGEYVAACVAGVFSLEDALPLVAERARSMSALPADGAMAAVFVGEERAHEAIAEYHSTISLAAINGAAHVVPSGRADHLAIVLARLERQGVRFTRLKVSHAFHSPLMEPMLPKLQSAAAAVATKPPRIGLVSNLTGSLFPDQCGPDAEYWSRHASQPVRFAAGLRSLRDLGCSVFIEIGPHPVLLGMGREDLSGSPGLEWLPSLRRGRPEWQQLLASAGAVWACGGAFDWRSFDREYSRRKVTVPSYPFQRQRYWPDFAPRSATKSVSTQTGWREWLYAPRWTPVDDAQDQSANFLPSPRDLADRVERLADPLTAEHGVSVYDDVYALVDRTCAAYIVDALQRLGWTLRPGERVTVDDLQQRLGIVARHHRLLARMLEILGEDGLLARDAAGWRVDRLPHAEDPRAMMAELRHRFPQCEGELSLTARCADRLPEVLKGERDPMQLLFPGGSLAETEALYQHAPAFRFFNALVAEVCAAATAVDRPAGRTATLLEIGGGTGGTTAYVLPALADRGVRYVFTDISGLFTARAREKFRAFDFVEYRTLDIEQDPSAQGFTRGGFEIVIASNVLHATADLRATLKRVRDLLAPGGLLVLLEGTRPQRFGDLTVGLTDGWWRFNDDLRPSYALMSAERWLAALTDLGFETPVAFPDRGASGPALFDNQSVILARAPQRTEAVALATHRMQPLAVVFADDSGQGRELVDALRACERRTIEVVQRDGWTQSDDHTYGLDCESVEDLRRLFDTLGPAMEGATLIHMRALHHGSADEPIESIEARIQNGCRSALAIVQATTALSLSSPPRLLLVTKGAQAVAPGEPPVDVAQGPLWGLGRVISLEHPELSTCLVDLSPDEDGVNGLVDIAMDDAGGETQIAWRAGRRHRLQIGPCEGRMTRHQPTSFGADATYFITGGLSGIGLAVADWMVNRGARHLVLMARSGPVASASALIERLRAIGADVVIALGDVSSRSTVERILASIDPRFPLRGVMHCAGVTDDAALAQMTWDRFERVLAAKVRGTWHLHALTADIPLDHFVLFSSAAALLGSRGQANHAAANAFLDAVAYLRRAEGLPASSINWGPWGEIGAATRGDTLQRMQKQGLRPIDPASGLAALEHVMGAGICHAAMLPIVWPDFLKHVPELQRRIFDASREAAPEPAATSPARAAQDLRSLSPARARNLLLAAVEREAARVLGITAAEGIDPRQPLNELGLDSLMAVELRTALGEIVGRPQPATLLFNYPSIGEVVDHLVAELQTDHAASTPLELGDRTAPHRIGDTTDIDDLSEHEIAALLAGKLADARS